MRTVTKTRTFLLNEYLPDESSCSGIYDVANMYTATNSTTVGYATTNGKSRDKSHITLKFDVSDLSPYAVITKVDCKAKINVSSTTSIETATIQLYNGSTAMGAAKSNRTATSTGSVTTIGNCGTWNRSNIENARLRYSVSNGLFFYSDTTLFRIFGAELIVTYTINEYEVNTDVTHGYLSDSELYNVYVDLGDNLEIQFFGNEDAIFNRIGTEGTEGTEGTLRPITVGLFHVDNNTNDVFNNSTLTNTGTFSTTRKFGTHSIYLNGSLYIKINLPSNYQKCTVLCWFNTTKANAKDDYPTLFSCSGGTYMHIDDGSYSNKPVCRSNNVSDVGTNVGGYGITTISRNMWHHFAYCRDGSLHYFFIDGILQYTVILNNPDSVQTLYFGCRSMNGSLDCNMQGYVDEISIKSDCEYTSNFSVPQTVNIDKAEYLYDITPTTDTKIHIIFDGQYFIWHKNNGTWQKVSKIFTKQNNNFILNADLTTVFDKNKWYIKFN